MSTAHSAPSGSGGRIAVSRPNLPGSGLERLQPYGDVVTWRGEKPPSADELAELACDAVALLCISADTIDRALLERCPDLRVVSTIAVGFDNLDLEALTERRIPAGNTPDVLSETTADLAWLLLMAAARRISEGIDFVRSGDWFDKGAFHSLGVDVHGATLGIIGLGRIGQCVARRAKGFGMRVLYNDLSPTPDAEGLQVEFRTLPELLSASDFVTIHASLTPSSRGLIDAGALSLMRPGAVLINTARGHIVDTRALYDALSQGRLGAAALDVTDPEPLPPDHPLLSLSNCIVLPHIGSATLATRSKMVDVAVDNVIAVLEGRRMPHCVNAAVYDDVASTH